MKRLTSNLIVLALLLLVCGFTRAADAPKWLDDQTVFVVRMSVDQSSESSLLLKMLVDTATPITNEVKLWDDELKAMGEAIRAAGGQEIIVVVSMSDAFADQPLLVVPGAKALDLNLLKSTFLGNGVLNPLHRAPSLTSASVDGDLIIGTQAVVERVSKAKSVVVADELRRVPNANNLLTITGTLNRDQRRALGEMVTTLPAYLGNGAASALVSEIDVIAMDVTKSHDLVVRISGKPDEIEARLKAIQTNMDKQGASESTVHSLLGKFILNELVGQKPVRDQNSLTWKLSLAKAMQSGLGMSLSKAVLESDRLTGMQRIKMLGLALHNYYSAFNKFPNVSTASNGKPRLLSWRVDLLPFLDEGELYQEFHLDEPWDSEHNKKLISRMPDVFRCPQSKHSPRSGLSTFVLPVHEKAMWVKERDIVFKDIEDGSSNTIMTVEVRDELAQVWTRPEPFEVDLAAPQQQLGGHFDGILFGAGDGSAQILPMKNIEFLPALITRSGGEVIQF